MITLLAIAFPLAAITAIELFGLKFGAEDRPGFNERRPLV